jgi:G3E family GTPase
MAARTSVPILLLTGFLGSGKTSLLARWLKAPELAGAMVIVNELGEVGIDDRLIETSSETPMLLDNGCACCAAGEDLTATLERLFWDRLHRKIPQFSWVLIETTGIADPAAILERLRAHSLISERYHVEGVVTTFDARLGAAQLKQHPECASQLVHASAIILTKADLASADELARAHAAAAAVRGDVDVLTSSHADISAAAMIAALAHSKTGVSRPHHHHSGHVHAVHSPNVTTAFAAARDAVDADFLSTALNAVMNEFGPALLRLKGIVLLKPNGSLTAVQAMQGVAVELLPLGADAREPDICGFTIIAQDVPAKTIADALEQSLADAPQVRPLQKTA